MKQCKPFDLEQVRTQLRYGEITLAKMCILIPIYESSCKYRPKVPESRLWEWEQGRTRSIPEYVYHAYGTVLCEDWASDRHSVHPSAVPDIDEFYANLLNPGFGKLMKTEHEVRQSNDPGQLALLPSLEEIREGWSSHYKSLIGLDMDPIWVEKLEDLFP